MRILILGGSGMLGHTAYRILSKDFDTYVTFNNFDTKIKNTGIFDRKKIFDNVDAFEIKKVINVINKVKPQVILNCIGLIKQGKEIENLKSVIYINSFFPHLLAECAVRAKARLIHISSDCVFSGEKGNYIEQDNSDAEDLYGRTKLLGEINYGGSLTLRTSIIGHELFSSLSLVNWFLSQKNKTVNGYTNAIYSGLTTVALCRELGRVIKLFPALKGLYHLSAEKISKYELLKLIKEVYKINVEIAPYEDFHCDRSLNSEQYRKLTSFIPQSWKEMITEMYNSKLEATIGGRHET